MYQYELRSISNFRFLGLQFRFLINYLTGSSDRNGQPNVSAYEYQNDTDLCQDNERENLAGYGNPFSKTGRTEKADYEADTNLFETNLSFSYKIYIFPLKNREGHLPLFRLGIGIIFF